ncbi:hypothetical protein BDFG_00378 [Blastomyces dermatitidis ATCC 26199]|nr:hypothetical protein BDFG_00378 [Blastomyces dermatitidis ATCC 26199]
MNDQKTLTRPLAYVPSWLNNDEHRPEIGCCGKPPSFGRNVVLINPPDSNTQQFYSGGAGILSIRFYSPNLFAVE